MKGRDSMKYLYKITVVIDDDKVLRFQQHDLNAIYQTVRDAFKDCNFVIEEGKDSFSEVGIVANSLYDSWLAKYLKKMEWYDASDNSTEDILKEIKDFDTQYGK